MSNFFEFQESDIIFSDDSPSSIQTTHDHGDGDGDGDGDSPSNPRSILHRNNIISKAKKNSSIPVTIPGNFNSSSSSSSDEFEFNGCFSDYEDDDYQIVPPHVIVDRRSGDFDGFVKVSKPKNLIHFRNSVLKLTGFLES